MRNTLYACIVAVAALVASPATAQHRVDLSTLTPAAGHKPVRTLRDLRFRDLVQQRYDFSCGSAALASLLSAGYGIPTSEPDLIRWMMTGADPREIIRNGFSMLDMKRYVESIGMRAHGFRVEADALYRLQMPVIALLDLKGYKHFVLVKGASAGRVFVADPALGHRVMNEQEFVAGWNGILLAVVGDRPLTDSYLVQGRSSAALGRRVEMLERATLPVPIVELGLVRADLF
ncbi:C39 family peptidase [Lysobacter humi (ex Lee et al. 2017)]